MARKSLETRVKKLTKYAFEFGRWTEKHTDENGKVLSKNLSPKDDIYKSQHEHHIEDMSKLLDYELSDTNQNNSNIDKVNQIIKQLEIEWKDNPVKKYQLEGIEELKKRLSRI